MSQCFVCEVTMLGLHGHHVVPQSEGGEYGPQVDLCGACHTVIHAAAKRMEKGRSADAHLAHLQEAQRERAMSLIYVILACVRRGLTNPNPQLTANVSPDMMRALDMFKADRGFTSRDAAIRSMLMELVRYYGLGQLDPEPEKLQKRTSLRQFRGAGKS